MLSGGASGIASRGSPDTPSRNRLAGFLDWVAEGSVGPFPASLALIAAFFAIQTVVTTLIVAWAGTGVGIDDAEQLSYMPFLWAGYGGSQPPLYTWFNIIAASVLGTNVLSLRLVKYLVMFVAVLAVHAAMRSMGYSRRSASAASLGLLLTPQILWSFQQTLSHSVASVAFSALALFAFVELQRRRTPIAYAAFGLAAAAMLLAKYNDAVVLAAMLIAALSMRETRATILNPRFAIAIAVAALALAPTTFWSLTHSQEVAARYYKFGIDESGWSPGAAVIGSWKLLLAVISCFVVPAAIFLTASWNSVRPPPPPEQAAKFWSRYLWRTVVIAVAATLALVIGAAATTVRDRWMLPVMPVLLCAMAASLDIYGERVRRSFRIIVGASLAAVLLTAPGIWAIQIYGGHNLGRARQLDYHALYRELTKDSPVGTVVSDRNWIGNLRLVDTGLTTLYVEFPDFPSLMKEPAVLVYLEGEQPSGLLSLLIKAAGFEPAGDVKRVNIPEPFGPEPRHRVATIVKLRKIPTPELIQP